MVSPERGRVEEADPERVSRSWGWDIAWDSAKEILAVPLDCLIAYCFEESFKRHYERWSVRGSLPSSTANDEDLIVLTSL